MLLALSVVAVAEPLRESVILAHECSVLRQGTLVQVADQISQRYAPVVLEVRRRRRNQYVELCIVGDAVAAAELAAFVIGAVAHGYCLVDPNAPDKACGRNSVRVSGMGAILDGAPGSLPKNVVFSLKKVGRRTQRVTLYWG